MSLFTIISVLLTLAALAGFVNYKFLKLPTTIGIMLIGLIFSIALIMVDRFLPTAILSEHARDFIGQVDFNKAVLECMLSFLLFAGALHIELKDLLNQKWLILILATFGVVLSTFIVGTTMYYLLPVFGLQFSYLYCLLFGSLIAPTDPVAVLGILKKVGASKSLETKITGESLFNDGVGVVVFLAILGLLPHEIGHGDHSHGGEMGAMGVAKLFFMEAGGGIFIGLILGYIAYRMLKQVDNYQVEILITLALVTGGYSLAMMLHMSGPLAMVVAGLMIGNQGRLFAMSQTTESHIDTFWELVDEVLNAVLFVLIGLEILMLKLNPTWFVLGAIAIPITLLGRGIAVSVPVTILKRFRKFSAGVIPILTWGGLRGGISVALALAMPKGQERDVFLTITYVIVIFSIAVQGLSLKHLIQYYKGKEA